jgi:arginyl-tRNA synthetase
MKFKKQIIKILENETKLSKREIEEDLEIPPSHELGDYAFPCFLLAKKNKTSAKKMAKILSGKIKSTKTITNIVANDAYINFFIDKEKFSQEVIKIVLKQKEKYGSLKKGGGKKVLIEFSGLNPNKAGHIGNARNTCIGDSVARILGHVGYKVIKLDYINDLGRPSTAVFWAIKNSKGIPKKQGILKKEDHWQGKVYTNILRMADKDEDIKQKISQALLDLETRKYPSLNKKQRKIADDCVNAQYKTWERMNAFHNLKIYESDIVFSGLFQKGIKKLLNSNMLYKEKRGEERGCHLVNLGKFKSFKGLLKPNKILIRADGTATYTGKDAIFQMWKFGLLPDLFRYRFEGIQKNKEKLYSTAPRGKLPLFDFKDVNSAIHVVGVEQSYVMNVLYSTLKALGFEREFKNSYHLAYGLVGFKGSSKISSRKGTAGLSVDEILDKTIGEAYKLVSKSNPILSEKQKKQIAEKVGSGAIRYFLIKESPSQFIKFTWEDVLRIEGNSGPYLQYTYARACNILKKARLKDKFDVSLLKENKEITLIKKISEFPLCVEESADRMDPSVIANYVFELAREFNTFYEALSVIKSKPDLKNTRLHLVLSVKYTMKSALSLLGIDALERV